MKLGQVRDVMVPLQVVLGGATISLQQLSGITEGSIIGLDSLAGEPVDLVVAGEAIAKGEVVVIDENFGIRVTALLEREAGG